MTSPQESPPVESEKPAKVDRQKAFVDAVLPALTQAVREEIRELGLVSIPDALQNPIVADLRKQRTVLSTMWEGVPPPLALKAEHFYGRFWQELFLFLTEIQAMNERPTIELATAWLCERGFPSPRIDEAIRHVVGTPAAIPIDEHAAAIIELAWQRRASEHVARAAALIGLNRLDESHKNEIDAELRAAVEAFAGVEDGGP